MTAEEVMEMMEGLSDDSLTKIIEWLTDRDLAFTKADVESAFDEGEEEGRWKERNDATPESSALEGAADELRRKNYPEALYRLSVALGKEFRELESIRICV